MVKDGRDAVILELTLMESTDELICEDKLDKLV